MASFPRKRESSPRPDLDPRFRGDDDAHRAAGAALRRHFTIPTAFIVAPRSLDDRSMNFANSAGGR